MDRALTSRRSISALAFGLAVLMLFTVVAPVRAQQQASSRFRVLIPKKLEMTGDVDDDFGEDLTEDLRERIDDLATHQPVDEDEFEDALDEYDIDEDELDCITSRQLAAQLEAQVVMCAVYGRAAGSEGMTVSARFLTASTGEAFEVPEFTAVESEEASQHIFSSFERYVNLLRQVTFCLDYLGSQQWENALDTCNQALEINPESERALYAKARALMELATEGSAAGSEDTTLVAADEAQAMELDTAQMEESLEVHEQVLELNPVHQDALKTAGMVAGHLDRTEVARDFFNRYLELNPRDTNVRLTVAIDLANVGDPEGALRIAEEGVPEGAAGASDASADVDLTLVEYTGHFALRAAQAVQQEQGADGGEEAAERAEPLFEKALQYYRQVFDAQGSEADATMLQNMIAALSELGRAEEAADLGSEVVAAKPDVVGLWSSYATALQRAGRVEEALAALDSIEARDPEYRNLNARRGQWLLRTDDVEGARAAFEAAVGQGSIASDAAARNIFAFAYNEKYDQGEHDVALDLFNMARDFAEAPQTLAMTHFWAGWILFQQGRQVQEPNTVESAEAALPLFQQALQHFQQSGEWTQTQGSINLEEVIGNTTQYIEIQEALISRG